MTAIIILACALSIDALSVGFTYSLKGIKIPVLSKIIICFISFCTALISVTAGGKLSQYLPYGLEQILSCAMLASLGGYLIISEFKSKKNTEKKQRTHVKLFDFTIKVISNPGVGDYNNSKIIETKEAIYIGFALSLDCIGAGFGYGISNANIWLFPFFVGLFQVFLISAGAFIGKLFSKLPINSRVISVMPGVILIVLSSLKMLRLF